ncbi:hypothetical protein FOS14_18800 [Skermania sp. ID1734]|uniref:hypothetical protein n=1 Tax=Skermania sp. ID1734 TaxID=2597516 RepID=UPI00117C72DA|nr:hypothetical protein [Skermania sp. ID1734]TSD95044.1 hypothetical protein FOS14_18800 [Skermania sp. ID1734]
MSTDDELKAIKFRAAVTDAIRRTEPQLLADTLITTGAIQVRRHGKHYSVWLLGYRVGALDGDWLNDPDDHRVPDNPWIAVPDDLSELDGES